MRAGEQPIAAPAGAYPLARPIRPLSTRDQSVGCAEKPGCPLVRGEFLVPLDGDARRLPGHQQHRKQRDQEQHSEETGRGLLGSKELYAREETCGDCWSKHEEFLDSQAGLIPRPSPRDDVSQLMREKVIQGLVREPNCSGLTDANVRPAAITLRQGERTIEISERGGWSGDASGLRQLGHAMTHPV